MKTTTIHFEVWPEIEGKGHQRSVTVKVAGSLRGSARASDQIVEDGYNIVQDSTTVNGIYPVIILSSDTTSSEVDSSFTIAEGGF